MAATIARADTGFSILARAAVGSPLIGAVIAAIDHAERAGETIVVRELHALLTQMWQRDLAEAGRGPAC